MLSWVSLPHRGVFGIRSKPGIHVPKCSTKKENKKILNKSQNVGSHEAAGQLDK